MEDRSCPNVNECTANRHFHTKSIRDVFTTLYCEGNFVKCARKKLKDSGNLIPEKLLPNGQYAS
ncbi:MAG: hypothetical protein PHE84_05095 [bacterium]|nr:hypothetical protein [bacterium]